MVTQHDWVDLSPYWDELLEAANKITDKKYGKSNAALPPNNYSANFEGFCAEKVYAIITNQKVNLSVLFGGDGGTDFTDVDVKGTKYWNARLKGSPWLLVFMQRPVVAKIFVLVGLDLNNKRGYIAGWATKEEVLNSEVIDWGYGPRYSIPCYNLHTWAAGMPAGRPAHNIIYLY